MVKHRYAGLGTWGPALAKAMKSSAYLKTQSALARRAGLGQSTVGRILRGEVDPQSDSLRCIARALRVPLSALLDIKPGESLNLGQSSAEPTVVENNPPPNKRTPKASLQTEEHKAAITVLAACRRERRVSQEDLAKRLGWRRSRIAEIESGNRRVDVAEFITIARALSLDPEHVFGKVVRW